MGMIYKMQAFWCFERYPSEERLPKVSFCISYPHGRKYYNEISKQNDRLSLLSSTLGTPEHHHGIPPQVKNYFSL